MHGGLSLGAPKGNRNALKHGRYTAEAIRAAGIAAGVPAAMLSRGLAGLADGVLVVNLAGSTGGVRDGMAVLAPVLRHAVDQAHGGDHPRAGAAG